MDNIPSERKEHPMFAVPDAIRTVLQQTALILLEKDEVFEILPTSSPFQHLLGKTIAEDVIMTSPGYPTYDASIMDGYAIKTCEDFVPGKEWTHSIGGKIFAGDTQKNFTTKSSMVDDGLLLAYYVTTGAPIPSLFDCVVPIEQCRVSADGQKISVEASATITKNKWIRPVGCDMPADSLVLPKGHMLDPISIGLLLQSGCTTIKVKKPVIVGILSTGNELMASPNAIKEIGKIPDVNRPILLALLSTFGAHCKTIDLGIQRDDDIERLTSTLKVALEKCDIIITSGGVSMGESDIMEKVLIRKLNGTLHFGRMHMKPGKPTTFVSLPRGKLIFAMPGNPVSATVCTNLLVKPCIDLLYNGVDNSNVDRSRNYQENKDEMVYRIVQNARIHSEISCKLSHNIKLDKERPEYHRVTFFNDKSGNRMAKSTGVQRSSRLINLRDAQGLLLLPQAGNKDMALAGEEYTALLLRNEINNPVRVYNSFHLNQRNSKESLQISIVYVAGPAALQNESDHSGEVSKEVKAALNDGLGSIISTQSYSGNALNLFDTVTSKCDDHVDLLVIVCKTFPGSFKYYLDLASNLRKRLVKLADSVALMARRGAAAENGKFALFETVAGFVPRSRGCMMVLVSEQGLHSSLSNIRDLLKHAVLVSRGT